MVTAPSQAQSLPQIPIRREPPEPIDFFAYPAAKESSGDFESGPSRRDRATEEPAARAESSRSDENVNYNAVFAAALSAQKKGNIGEAIARYSEIIDVHPDIADLYINRGAAYVSTRDLDLALDDLNKALELEPKFMAYRNRGSAYFIKRDFERAIHDYNAALELEPGNVDTHIYRGLAFSNLATYDLAIQDYSEALTLDPGNAVALTEIGIINFHLGDHENAIKNYNEALKSNPGYPFIYLNRGASYSARGDRDNAERDFNKALELNPNYSDAYGMRSLIFVSRGEFDLALRDLERALQLNPGNPYTHMARGSVYLEKGELDLAIRDLGTALARAPENNIAYCYRGVAYERMGDLTKAIQDYDRALSIRPEKSTFANRGFALLRLSRWDRAKSDLLSARNMGMDIVSVFRAGYGTVAAFEEQHEVKLPQDLADLVGVEEAPQPHLTGESILEMFRKIRESVPPDTWDDLPTDLVKNKKHYLYGHPKETR